jgi:uncharacterized protein (TIRG00374 family)
METNKTQRDKRRKIILTALFILLNVGVVGVAAVIDFGDRSGVSGHDLLDMAPGYFLVVPVCFFAAIFAETAKYYTLLKYSTDSFTFGTAFRVAVLGKYYDNITPFGSGGQPFQVMYLHKQKIPTGTATALPIAGYLMLQTAFIFIAIIVLIFGGRVMDIAAVRITAGIGLAFYIFVPLVIVLFVVSPALTLRTLSGVFFAIKKLRILRDAEKTRLRVLAGLTSYSAGMETFLRNRRLALKSFGYSLLFQISVCLMPFFVLRAFGSDLTFLSVFCTTVILYLCITFVPTPGNSGVAEGSFYALFSVLGESQLFWAMLIWRFFCYYAFILFGFILVSRDAVHKDKAALKAGADDAEVAETDTDDNRD